MPGTALLMTLGFAAMALLRRTRRRLWWFGHSDDSVLSRGGRGDTSPLLARVAREAFLRFFMARYEHLPIYKQAMDVAVRFEKVVAGFSRYHKYTLGTEMLDKSGEIVSHIIRANAEHHKAPKLIELRGQLDELFILIRLAQGVQAFKSFSAYQFTVEQVASICRQNGGWLRSVTGKQGNDVQSGPEAGRRRRRSDAVARRPTRAD